MNLSKKYYGIIMLLFPAILGGIIYDIFKSSSIFFTGLGLIEYVITFELLVVYAFDYLYTVDDTKKPYTGIQLIFDILIVACLYLNINAVIGSQKFFFDTSCLFILMAATKVLCYLWEVISPSQDSRARITDLIFFGFYIVFDFSQNLGAFATILLFDIAVYFYWENIRKKQ